jgi:hypothetical protein
MWKESQGKYWLKIGKKNLLKGLFHETEKDHTFDFGVGLSYINVVCGFDYFCGLIIFMLSYLFSQPACKTLHGGFILHRGAECM